MATELKTDKMPVPQLPAQGIEDTTELLKHLQRERDFLVALLADVKKLRDTIDSNHP